jgi:hypothetical protein
LDQVVEAYKRYARSGRRSTCWSVASPARPCAAASPTRCPRPDAADARHVGDYQATFSGLRPLDGRSQPCCRARRARRHFTSLRGTSFPARSTRPGTRTTTLACAPFAELAETQSRRRLHDSVDGRRQAMASWPRAFEASARGSWGTAGPLGAGSGLA